MKLKTLIIVTFITIFVNQTLLSNELEFSGSFSSKKGDLLISSSLVARYNKEQHMYFGVSIPLYYQNKIPLKNNPSPIDDMRVKLGISSRYLSLGKLRSQGAFALLRYISHKGDITRPFAVDPVTLGNPISVLFRIPDRAVASWDITQRGQLFSFSLMQHISAVTLGIFIYRFTSWEYAKTPYVQSGGHGLISYQKNGHIFHFRGGVSLSTLHLSYGYLLRGDYLFKRAPWSISCVIQGNNRSFTLPNGKGIDSNLQTEISVTYKQLSLLGEFIYKPSYFLNSGYKKIYTGGSFGVPLRKYHTGTVGYYFLYVKRGDWNTTISHTGEISYIVDWETWKILSTFELVYYPLEYRNGYIGKVEYQLYSDPWKVHCSLEYDFSVKRIKFSGKIIYEKNRKRVSFVVEEDKRVSLVFLWKL